MSELLNVGQIVAIIAAGLEVIAVQRAKRKNILLWFILSDLVFALSYVLYGLKSAAVIVCVDTVITIVNYRLSLKDKKIGKILGSIFIIIAISTSLYTCEKTIDVLPIISSVTYTLSVMQTKEKNIRCLIFVNLVSWLTYDIYGKAYVTSITDTCSLVSTIVGIIRYDLLKGGLKKYDNRQINRK